MGEIQSRTLHTIKRKITEDYDLTPEVLGVGINGKVLMCRSREDGKKYALKSIYDNSRARREAELHFRASVCPNVVQLKAVYECKFQGRNCLMLVMEYMSGGELFDRIHARRESPFTEQEATQIVRQICTAIAYLHNFNIAHRDLKPENLLYTDPGPDAVLKLSDFGFAKAVVSSKHPLQTPCYSAYYVAPEVLSDDAKYDKSCDIWSLGVIMYILLCGYPPFYSEYGLQPLSSGMKQRIRSGRYTFPDREWKFISSSAKDLIHNMLRTDPTTRLTIEEVIAHPWITGHTDIPDTPLATCRILQEDWDQWFEVQNEMNNALSRMRVDEDSVVLKNVNDANNRLIKKRQNKSDESKPSSSTNKKTAARE